MKTGSLTTEQSAAGFRFAIVVTRWHSDLTSSLETAARTTLVAHGAVDNSIITYVVPGAFELPLVCLKAAESGIYDAVIALGVVIRGDTPHFE